MLTSEDPTGELKAARDRHHAAILLAGRDAPRAVERDGAIWGHRALRWIAFGAPDCECPEGTDPLDALAAVETASKRLCSALAASPDYTATGRRVNFFGAALPSVLREGMKAEAFEDPYFGLDLRACLVLDYSAAPIEMIDAWARAGRPGWCEILLPQGFVSSLREVESTAAPDAHTETTLSIREERALAWMTETQRQTVAQRGIPMGVRPLGQMMKDAPEAGYPARWADKLYAYLPEELRNPARR